jgi:hypothetical protein
MSTWVPSRACGPGAERRAGCRGGGDGGLADDGGEQTGVAQAGGVVMVEPGPSMRMMAWKWTTPRRWYSATLANERRAWSRKAV